MNKLKNFILSLSLVCAMACSVFADVEVYSYKKHNPRTRKTVNEYDLKIERLPDGMTKFNRTIVSKRSAKEEEFVLNGEYETIKWYTKQEKKDTEYSGLKEGKVITLKGKLEGKDLNRRLEIDDKPFFFTPKFNLKKFVLSDEKHIEFWMLRKDKLTKYLMEATKKGEVAIKVNGEEVPAIKVRFAATGKAAKYYKRTYYFRKSDGMFIKRTALDGAITELISKK